VNQIFIEIESLDSLTTFLTEANKKGLLKDISPEKVRMAFRNKTFPIKVPVDLNSVLDLAGGPVAKMFGKKIENATLKYLETAIRAG